MDYKRVLVLGFTNGMSSREISGTTVDGKATINEFLKRFKECKVLTYDYNITTSTKSSKMGRNELADHM